MNCYIIFFLNYMLCSLMPLVNVSPVIENNISHLKDEIDTIKPTEKSVDELNFITSEIELFEKKFGNLKKFNEKKLKHKLVKRNLDMIHVKNKNFDACEFFKKLEKNKNDEKPILINSIEKGIALKSLMCDSFHNLIDNENIAEFLKSANKSIINDFFKSKLSKEVERNIENYVNNIKKIYDINYKKTNNPEKFNEEFFFDCKNIGTFGFSSSSYGYGPNDRIESVTIFDPEYDEAIVINGYDISTRQEIVTDYTDYEYIDISDSDSKTSTVTFSPQNYVFASDGENSWLHCIKKKESNDVYDGLNYFMSECNDEDFLDNSKYCNRFKPLISIYSVAYLNDKNSLNLKDKTLNKDVVSEYVFSNNIANKLKNDNNIKFTEEVGEKNNNTPERLVIKSNEHDTFSENENDYKHHENHTKDISQDINDNLDMKTKKIVTLANENIYGVKNHENITFTPIDIINFKTLSERTDNDVSINEKNFSTTKNQINLETSTIQNKNLKYFDNKENLFNETIKLNNDNENISNIRNDIVSLNNSNIYNKNLNSSLGNIMKNSNAEYVEENHQNNENLPNVAIDINHQKKIYAEGVTENPLRQKDILKEKELENTNFSIATSTSSMPLENLENENVSVVENDNEDSNSDIEILPDLPTSGVVKNFTTKYYALIFFVGRIIKRFIV